MSWDIEQARQTYNVKHWGGGYFDVNPQGRLAVFPDRDRAKPGIDLFELVHEARKQSISLPVLLRFTDILHDRVDALCGAFDESMARANFQGGYTAVYPIKVNQQRTVVEQICHHGGGRVGLEAGSKPELMAVLGLSQPNGVVVCNGYKDREYIRLALIGRQMGHCVYIVIEKLSELQLVLEESASLGVEPLLGIRVRLASISAGKWQNTGGDKSKFGLTAGQVLDAVRQLQQAAKLESLQLLHCHLGSQIANIRDIERGMSEVARYYAELHSLGVAIDCVDVGGGLGVDYEGTRSRSYYSMNYSVEEYAEQVVSVIAAICNEHQLPHPMLVSESGRALTAHHAVLVTNVIDSDTVSIGSESCVEMTVAEPAVVTNLRDLLRRLKTTSPLEIYHDAVHFLEEAHQLYSQGEITLSQRADAEQIYFSICSMLREQLSSNSRGQRELLDELNQKLADKYFCNFSLFQSLPDVWGIGQVFPIMPLHRLDEQPTRRVIIQDMTCDSDGRIDQYVDNEGLESSLPLHNYSAGDEYLLAMMLVGAYQETLGDMHNLFGDTDSIDVELTDDKKGFQLVRPELGDTVDELLSYVHFNPQELLDVYRDRLDVSGLNDADKQKYFEVLESGLSGYTYHEE